MDGKPGDHPLTDILRHGFSEFGPEVARLVTAMAGAPRFDENRAAVVKVLDECTLYGRPERKDELIAEAKRRLEAIAADLSSSR